MHHGNKFETAYRGNLTILLRWQQLYEIWGVVRRKACAGWYIYAVGTPVPTQASASDAVIKFITEVNTLLHKERHENYCGFSNHTWPGWLLSLIPPQPLESKHPVSAARQYW